MLVERPEEEVKNNEYPSRDSSLNFSYYLSFFGCCSSTLLLCSTITLLPGIACGVVGGSRVISEHFLFCVSRLDSVREWKESDITLREMGTV